MSKSYWLFQITHGFYMADYSYLYYLIIILFLFFILNTKLTKITFEENYFEDDIEVRECPKLVD